MVRQRVLCVLALALARVMLAFAPGYVHPDEWHQSNEPTARDLYGVDATIPWEFDRAAPARSIVGAYLSAGIAHAVARAVGAEARTAAAAAPRALGLALSTAADGAVVACARAIGVDAFDAWCLFASSWVVLVVLVRPFSNSTETLAAAACALAATARGRDGGRRDHLARCAAVGAIGGVAVFVRFTSAVYVAPWAALVVMMAGRESLATAALGALSGVATAALAAVACVVTDTAYFSGKEFFDESVWIPRNWIVTPWNSFSYNARVENLAAHGLHPRYLHAAVNGPLMFGPLWFVVWLGIFRTGRWKRSTSLSASSDVVAIVRTLQASVALPLAALSLAPHQEPRFLAAMIVPTCALAAFHAKEFKVLRRSGFFLGWIALNAALTCLFGVLHQGGVVPAMRALANVDSLALGDASRVRAIFWKTYMPPRALLGQKIGDDRVSITDIAGASAREARELLASAVAARECAAEESSCAAGDDRATLLIAPALAFDHLRELTSETLDFELAFERFPHLSLDHLDDVRRRLARASPRDRVRVLLRSLRLTAHVVTPRP